MEYSLICKPKSDYQNYKKIKVLVLEVLMEYIKRDSYLNQLIRLSKTQDIKVITGVRRSGKSVLLEMLKGYLLKHEDNINIVSINL